MEQNFVALRTGNPGKLPAPVEYYRDHLEPQIRAMLNHVLKCSAFGSPEDVAAGLGAFIRRTQVDEVIVHGSIFDPEARLRSMALVARAFETVRHASGRPD